MNSYEVQFINEQNEVEVAKVTTNVADIDQIKEDLKQVLGMQILTVVRCDTMIMH